MTREPRSLPALAPGSVDTPFVVKGYDEAVSHDTLWDAHSHPFHELLRKERGTSSSVVGERIWTITPALDLWMPAGTLHSGSATAGTLLRASFSGIRTTSSISAPRSPVDRRTPAEWASELGAWSTRRFRPGASHRTGAASGTTRIPSPRTR